MRQKILIANWKMNADYISISKFFSHVKMFETIKVMIAPSYLGIIPSKGLSQNKNIEIISQNVSSSSLGNHTGSISWIELKDYGIKTTFIGHPDVKADFKEKNFHVNEKLIKLLKNGIKSVLFIEETRVDLAKDSTKENIKLQINQIFEGISSHEIVDKVYLVYKPTFIGEIGIKPDLSFIFNTIKIIRDYLRTKFGFFVGNNLPILYGGEISNDDLESICKNEELDGILIEDERALSYKFIDIVYKHLINGSKESYYTYYDKNLVVELPTEEQRIKDATKTLDFDVYDISSELYFGEIKLEEEDI